MLGLIHLHLVQKGAGIYEIESVDIALGFGCFFVAQGKKGIELVGGGTSAGVNALHTVVQGGALKMTLVVVCTVERDHIIVQAGQIQGKGHTFFQLHGRIAPVAQEHIAGNHILFIEDGIVEKKLTAGNPVRQLDFQCFFAVGGGEGQAFNFFSAL